MEEIEARAQRFMSDYQRLSHEFARLQARYEVMRRLCARQAAHCQVVRCAWCGRRIQLRCLRRACTCGVSHGICAACCDAYFGEDAAPEGAACDAGSSMEASLTP